MNNFGSGYCCSMCVMNRKYLEPLVLSIPVYIRVGGKFMFDNMVKCTKHGYTPAISYKDAKGVDNYGR